MARKGPNVRLWIRRAHLYSGLALLPWVLLYAVSGMLFNHPSWGSRDDAERFSLTELGLDHAALDAHQSANALAAALGPGVSVEATPAPRLRRSLRAVTVSDEQDRHQLSVRFPSGRGRWAVQDDETPRRPASLREVDRVDVPEHDAAAWQAVADSIASEHGSARGTELRGVPSIRFHARIDGEVWLVDFHGKTGAISFEAVADRDVSFARLLARLHMTHVYPDAFGIAWVHALIVDLAALCLAMWGLTGVFMWWQMRRTRTTGAVVLISGLAATVVILAEVVPSLLS